MRAVLGTCTVLGSSALGAVALAVCALLAPSLARAQDLSLPGPFAAGWRTVDVGAFDARVHYPALSAGQNAPVDPAAGPCAAITFGHGFLTPVTSYLSTFDHLASHGYVVIATQSQGGFFPSHAQYALDMRQCLTWLEQADASAGDPFFGFIDASAFGASGHSMGGGASMLAAADDPRIRAVANLAAANTNPSAIAASADITVPVSLISGSQDSITPVSNHGVLMYASLAGPRTLPNIQGGYHCGFIDVSPPIGCDSGSISRSEQLALTRALLTEFFNLHLRSDDSLWARVWADEGKPGVTFTTDARATLAAEPPALAIDADGSGQTTLTLTRSAGPTSDHTLYADGPFGVAFAPAVLAAVGPGSSADSSATIDVAPDAAAGPATIRLSARAADGSRAYVDVAIDVLDAGCAADIAPPGGDGAVNTNDFFAFLSLYQAGDAGADFSPGGGINTNDFFAYLAAYQQGC